MGLGRRCLSRALGTAIAALSVSLVSPAPAGAHLCNDVFAQARDNLAVKVDIRDGQLRIAEKAAFRVYLLNTMDRPVANIALIVSCPQFSATVTPAPSWGSYPRLDTIAKGGKKEWFEVSLARKSGVKDGRYKIELHLVNGQDTSKQLKTMDLTASADSLALPKVSSVKVDGSVGSDEWKSGLLVSDFYTYDKVGNFYENVRAADQPRYRIAVDATYLYALFTAKKGDVSDTATLYVAKDPDSTPVSIDFDVKAGKPTSTLDLGEVLCKANSTKDALEVRIPRKLLGIEGKVPGGVYVNVRRTLASEGRGGPVVSYWRGNRFSVASPVVYARLTLPE